MADTTLIAAPPARAPKDRRVVARLILLALFLMVGAAWGVGLTLLV